MDNASLRNVHATNADLSGASLVGAVLCSMTACNSTWRTCNFQDANLGHSVFCGAIFNGLRLQKLITVLGSFDTYKGGAKD